MQPNPILRSVLYLALALMLLAATVVWTGMAVAVMSVVRIIGAVAVVPAARIK